MNRVASNRPSMRSVTSPRVQNNTSALKVRGNGIKTNQSTVNGKTTTTTSKKPGTVTGQNKTSLASLKKAVNGKAATATKSATGNRAGATTAQLPKADEMKAQLKEMLTKTFKAAGIPEDMVKSALSGLDGGSNKAGSALDNSKDSFCGTDSAPGAGKAGQSDSSTSTGNGTSASSNSRSSAGASATDGAKDVDGSGDAGKADGASEANKIADTITAELGKVIEALLKKMGVGETQSKEILGALSGGKAKGSADSSSMKANYSSDSFAA